MTAAEELPRSGSGPGSTPGPGLELLATAWRTALDEELPAAVALRHELHARPEVSGKEFWTAERVVEAIGLPSDDVAGTGRLLRVGSPGPAVAVRAELDALPVQEQTGATYSATGDAMHACGHDVHLAALVALTRSALRLSGSAGGPGELPCGLVALLQPREEVGPTGARDVVASGLLQQNGVRGVIGAHVQPRVPAGQVSIEPGPVNAGVDEFEITVTGRPGHTGYPHLAADPVATLCRCVLALQDVLRGRVDPMHPATLTVTQLLAGTAPNVIPGAAWAAGTLRTMHATDAAALYLGMADAVAGIASAFGCDGQLSVIRGEPALVNDPVLAARAAPWLHRFGLGAQGAFASCGSDDFASYVEVAPIAMLFVGATPGDPDGTGPDGRPWPMLHDPRFLPADALVGDVAHAMLAGVLAAVPTLSTS